MDSRFENKAERIKAKLDIRVGRNSNNSNLWTGIFILLIGVVALLKVTNPDLPRWVFSWKMFLIGLGLFMGFKHNFKGVAWLILILVGAAFIITDITSNTEARKFIWPGVLIIGGLYLILRPRNSWHSFDDDGNFGSSDPALQTETTYTKDDFIDSTCIFSGSKKRIISKNFKGGDIVNIFGGNEIDLTQADMTHEAVIEVTTIFGGTKLIIPSNWEIKSEAVMIFGGIEDKRHIVPVAEAPSKTIVLKGTVIFGGIDIKNF